MVKNKTSELIDNFKILGDSFKNSLSGVDFKPVISTLDSLLTILTKIGGTVGNKFSSVAESMSKLKDSLANMTANIDFAKLEEAINITVSALVFLYNEVSKVFDIIKEKIKTFAVNVWNALKSIFEASNEALSQSETNILSWSDFIYDIFNNTFRGIQDFINSVSAMLKGDWVLAWEYMKLACARVADSILDILSTIVNAFPKMIQKITDWLNKLVETANKVRKWMGLDEWDLIEPLKNVDFSKSSGLEKFITDTENKISDMTGKVADKAIKDMERFSIGSSGILQGFVDNFTEAVDQAEKELDDLSGNFKVTPSPSQVKDDLDDVFKIVTEWDEKLLQQRLSYLEEHGKDYTDEYHKIQSELIETERKREIQSANSAGASSEEIAKINEYYNNEMEEEDKRFEKAKRKRALETAKIVISSLKSIAKTAIDIFKKVASTIKDVFTTVAKTVKETFSSLVGLFSKLFEFNPDEVLDSLLEIEDAVLTFFVETLPQLPAFFESAFQSVLVLVQTLMDTIDWDSVGNFLNQIVDVFVDNAPAIVKGIVDIFSNIVETVTQVFIESAPEIVNAFGDIFFSIIESLPGILNNVLNALGEAISAIGKYLADNGAKLADDCVKIVQSIVDNLIKFISNGGWKNLLDALLAIQQALEKSVTENIEEIGEAIIDGLPDLMNFLKNSIISASKTLAKIAPTLLKVIVEIIATVLEVAFDPDVIESSFDVVENVIAGLIQGIITLIAKLIPVAIKLILNFPKMLAGLIEAIVTGLIKGFLEVDWIQVIVDIFTGFVDAFKDFFGIHSPSTLFEDFGTNMVEGLVIGLKGISESVMIILQPFFDLIESVIKDIIDGVGKIIDSLTKLTEVSFDGLNTGLQTVVDGLTEVTQTSFDGVNKGLETVTDALTEITSTSFDGVNEGLRTVGSSINTLTKTSINGLNEGLKIATDALTEITSVSFTGVNTGLKNILSGLESITKFSFNGLNTGLKNVLNFMTDISKVSFNGLNSGLNIIFEGTAKITDSISKLVEALTKLVEVVGKISGLGGGGLGLGNLGLGDLSWKDLLDPMGNLSKIGETWQDDSKSTIEKIGDTALDIVDPTGIVDVIADDDKNFWEKTGDVALRIIDPLNLFSWWATGTNSAPKGLSIVGEAGPELVNFRGGEQVLNSHNTQKALEGMSGTTINQNVTFNNLQDTTAFAMLQQLKQYNRQMAINGVI